MSENDSPFTLDSLQLNEEVNIDDQPKRVLRERKKKGRVAKNETEIFPEGSRRERRKVKKLTSYNITNKKIPYDAKGVLVDTEQDVCDCMIEGCPGCHFPCPKCRSNKCGHECRQNRKWVFNWAEEESKKGTRRYNPHIKKK